MTKRFVAEKDTGLSAVILDSRSMVYRQGKDEGEDRPPHVRAASGLTAFREYLAVVQDDANWLALIDAANDIHAVPLPKGPESEARIFSKDRGNKHEKFDLEACITVPDEDGVGHELIGLGSGSHVGREWILRVHENPLKNGYLDGHAVISDLGIELRTAFVDARVFYDSLRDNKEFSGAGLNIEGAILIDDDMIRLFERGNAPVGDDGHEPVDATGDVSWRALRAHLEDPDNVPPPAVENICRYDLGKLEGVRLTFSDAENLGQGYVLFSASAENPETDDIAGSVLGVIEPDGRTHWTEVIDTDGKPFKGKIEGLSRHANEPDCVHFVIDEDDETLPSRFFTARLSGELFAFRES